MFVLLASTSSAPPQQARVRGKLFPHVSSVVVEDSRSRTLQMLSVGEAALALGKCSQLWEGETR